MPLQKKAPPHREQSLPVPLRRTAKAAAPARPSHHHRIIIPPPPPLASKFGGRLRCSSSFLLARPPCFCLRVVRGGGKWSVLESRANGRCRHDPWVPPCALLCPSRHTRARRSNRPLAAAAACFLRLPLLAAACPAADRPPLAGAHPSMSMRLPCGRRLLLLVVLVV
jgi:hypothetical protein